jgi:lipopolysaccharide/colanic/teichoic acid biosynthesis glycosyltransferase
MISCLGLTMIKRLFDITFASVGLILLSPIFVWLSITIMRQDSGPVFYRPPRVGKNKQLFFVYKFRSMVMDADRIGGPTTSSNDPRVTEIGKKIRKYKLDELAQLINVFLGHMSLVGPRPEIPSEVETYNADCDKIFSVRPGITDYSSIEFRDEGDIIQRSGMADPHEAYRKIIQPRKLELQKKYVDENSLWIDLKIIIKTLVVIFN